MPVVPLPRFRPPLALEVRPLARLRADGRIEIEAPAWLPPEGPCLLVLWRPGPDEPAFGHVEGELRRAGGGWRFDGPAAAGWVVHAAAQGRRRKA